MAERESVSESSPLLNGHENGISKPNDNSFENADIADAAPSIGPDVERQESRDAGREAQFAGMPEVRERLKYIVPTISIGVSLIVSREDVH